MKINIDYPPTVTGAANTDIAALRAWCVMLLEELNLSMGSISSGAALSASEKVVNWK